MEAAPNSAGHTQRPAFGALPRPGGGTVFRLWAPSCPGMQLLVADRAPIAMRAEADGFLSAETEVPAGTPYQYRMPDGTLMPDPASRRQQGDVNGPSLVVDPAAYAWRDTGWRGRPWHETVVYELHAGAFGGFAGIQRELPRLKQLGVTAIQLMPVADFPGQRNWGYDGALPYAPDAAYGTPEDFKALVDAAHEHGLMVFLDVVYNHFGPDGNYLNAYAKSFFRDDIKTPWGAAIDFRRRPVRDFFIGNALMWLDEYHLDGLRFDAVHHIAENFLDELAASIRAATPKGRHVHLVLENENNSATRLRRGFDAQWADDIHHCLHVMLTDEREGYYEDFQDASALLARCCREGFAYQGEVSPHGGAPRGEPSGDLPPTAFVACLQNHDQIGNRAMGERLASLAEPRALRAATAFLLLAPFVPMLFMGEEIGSRAPFLFFTDHHDELAELVRNGRREEFKHFAAFQDPERRARIPDPNAAATFEASVPAWNDPDRERQDFVRDLLAVRAARIMPGLPGCRSDGAEARGPRAVIARWRLGTGETLILACNLGSEPVRMPNTACETLFETENGASAALCGGSLPPHAAVALIEA